MKRRLKYFFLICCSLSVFSISAQQVNTMYFMDNIPYRNTLNPAFQPYSNFYLGFPVIGHTNLGLGNNSLSLTDIFNPDGTFKNYYSLLKPNTQLYSDVNINLLTFGFRTGKSYWNFSLTERADMQVNTSKDLFNFGLNQVPFNSTVSNFGFDLNLYTEAGLGYSTNINEKWTVGGKLKLLIGSLNASIGNTSMILNNANNLYTVNGKGTIKLSSPLVINGFTTPVMPTSPTDYIKPSGIGAGIDLGISYKPIKNLTFSAALVDLGMINWTGNVKYKKYDVHINNLPITKLDSIGNYSGNFYNLDSVSNTYATNTTPKLNIGGEYGFFENKLTLGLLSRTMFQSSRIYEELTASINVKPIDWFDLTGSYSILNGRTSNIGLGLGLRTGFVHWFVAADYLPLNMQNTAFNLGTPPTSTVLPLPNSQALNFAFGITFVFGNRKDADNDGVIDRRDKCPETPFSVVVDKKGCPLDTDGDGVADYIDKCAKTPPEAYSRINQDGCPIDTDGDGIPDYLDKCPDSPVEARGFIDAKGCEMDTDGDGIFDYKDKCPNTPAGVKVDSNGCPLDTDLDGIPDYKDKCPGTPAEARNMVDSLGCPLDKDLDGVPDYLDLCPNTPAEARAYVDKNGCTLDKDGDGIADYLDKCPDTPIEARGTIDEHGCPRDTDGDGIVDYQDNCPKIPGVASNKGCPEIKKEVKALFKKALQGIQFETAKFIIKPISFKILDQVAKVLIENPTYLVEVQGHTDNAGKPEANMILSDNRANAVKQYLINKGVAAERMTSHGYGQTMPVASNKTKAGMALNRRVEFVVTFEETVKE